MSIQFEPKEITLDETEQMTYDEMQEELGKIVLKALEMWKA